jgi:two-component system NtrC family sensor kinase
MKEITRERRPTSYSYTNEASSATKNERSSLDIEGPLNELLTSEDLLKTRKMLDVHPNSKQPLKVLLVEDNWDHGYLATRALTAEGRYQVELVSSGAEALYKLSHEKFSVLLLDYCLSGMTGLDLIQKVREMGDDVPIIMITGLGSEAVAVEAMKMGAYDYIVKSGNYITTLPFVIDKALDRYELKKVKEHWDHWIFKRNQELGALNIIAAAISKSLNLGEVLKIAVMKTVQILEADYGEIHLSEEIAAESALALQANALPAPSTNGEAARTRAFSGILRHVLQTGEMTVVDDIAQIQGDPWSGAIQGLKVSAHIPLRSKETVLGVLSIGSRKPLQFTSQDRMLLNAIGNQIGAAIENAGLYEEIKRQAERLRESENKYRVLVEGANDAVLIIQDGRIRYVNQKAAHLTGYSIEALYQMSFLDLIAPSYRDLLAVYCTKRMNDEEAPNFETLTSKKDGSEITLDINASRIEYESKPAIQIIARDITEQKRMREQLIQSERLSAIGEFVAGVAHEINNPLTSVMGFSQILLTQLDLGDDLRDPIEKIYRESKRTAQIVRNLLSFAQQRKLDKVRVDINELLDRTLMLRAYKLKLNNIEVAKELHPDLPWVRVDPLQLQLVFLNIVTNAEQAMVSSRGGGRLHIRSSLVTGAEGAVELEGRDGSHAASASRSPSWVQIEFSDDGPGIRKENLRKIFDPFFTTKEVGKGTGLGLSISYGIIKEHSGEIYAQSEEGTGATFVIQLPVPRAEM